MITAERLHELLVYEADTGHFRWKSDRRQMRAGGIAGGTDTHGYRQIKIDGRLYLAHRLAVLSVTGEWPKQDVDHINMNRSDNRWINLRQCSRIQNTYNTGRRPHNTSGFKGVTFHKATGKWEAQIRANGRSTHLGLAETPEDAAKLYEAAAAKYHGEFARVA
jgi:hypothetical protein